MERLLRSEEAISNIEQLCIQNAQVRNHDVIKQSVLDNRNVVVVIPIAEVPRGIIKCLPVKTVVEREEIQERRNIANEQSRIDTEITTRQRRRGSEQTTRTWPSCGCRLRMMRLLPALIQVRGG